MSTADDSRELVPSARGGELNESRGKGHKRGDSPFPDLEKVEPDPLAMDPATAKVIISNLNQIIATLAYQNQQNRDLINLLQTGERERILQLEHTIDEMADEITRARNHAAFMKAKAEKMQEFCDGLLELVRQKLAA